MYKQCGYVLLVALVLWGVGGNAVQAATLYLDASDSEIDRGDVVRVAARLDTDEAAGECVNVVDAVITYSPNILPLDVSLGRSIFSVWVEEPTINTDDRTITFAGGIPNGYCGRIQGDPRLTNVIADIIFRSPGMTIGGDVEKDDSTARVEFTDQTRVFLNDGAGTEAQLATSPVSIELSDRTGQVSDPWRALVDADEVPPQPFSISLDQDEKAFGQRYFITFGTTDKQTGIDHYEVMEEPLDASDLFTWGSATAPWIKTRSPYVLKNQTLNSTIRVKAIDKAGNEYIATLVPDEALRTTPWQTTVVYAAGATVLVLVLLGVGWLLWRRRRRDRTNEQSEDSAAVFSDDQYE